MDTPFLEPRATAINDAEHGPPGPRASFVTLAPYRLLLNMVFGLLVAILHMMSFIPWLLSIVFIVEDHVFMEWAWYLIVGLLLNAILWTAIVIHMHAFGETTKALLLMFVSSADHLALAITADILFSIIVGMNWIVVVALGICYLRGGLLTHK